MWTHLKPWLKRWVGLTLNTLGIVFLGIVAVLEFAGTSVDWKELVGDEKAVYIIPAILAMNIFLRVVVTRTKGSPND
jgi:hypothetical protein